MKVSQTLLSGNSFSVSDFADLSALNPALVLAFGSVDAIRASAGAIAGAFPDALRAGCSTAGEISEQGVSEEALVVTALQFDHTRVAQVSTVLGGMEDSRAAGRRLAEAIPAEGLRTIMIFAQGVRINGSALLTGMSEILGSNAPITGGLAGDGGGYRQTWVLDNAGISSDRITCVGLYGDALEFSHGSFGGWSPFGPARKVTRSINNVLFELDGEAALQVYKRHLGRHAKDLPASGMLFPFSMLGSDHSELGLIRTVLAVDENAGSLTLAGDIDANGYLKLMHANTDLLVAGAEVAARAAYRKSSSDKPGLALLVSCVGRKLVMGRRVDEEVDIVRTIFGNKACTAGFYSYGEISPFNNTRECKFHNQTMTISFITEVD